MFIPLSILSEFLFIEPFVIFHVIEDRVFSFTLLVAISVISAIVIPMNIYRIRILQKSTTKIGGSLVGSIIGASAGICSCGPIGFSIISTFGTIAGTATAFLTITKFRFVLFHWDYCVWFTIPRQNQSLSNAKYNKISLTDIKTALISK